MDDKFFKISGLPLRRNDQDQATCEVSVHAEHVHRAFGDATL